MDTAEHIELINGYYAIVKKVAFPDKVSKMAAIYNPNGVRVTTLTVREDIALKAKPMANRYGKLEGMQIDYKDADTFGMWDTLPVYINFNDVEEFISSEAAVEMLRNNNVEIREYNPEYDPDYDPDEDYDPEPEDEDEQPDEEDEDDYDSENDILVDPDCEYEEIRFDD